MIKVQITSPSRALCLLLNPDTKEAIFNGNSVRISFDLFQNAIINVYENAKSLPHPPALDDERCEIELDGKKKVIGHGQDFDKILSLLTSLE